MEDQDNTRTPEGQQPAGEGTGEAKPEGEGEEAQTPNAATAA